MTQSYAGYIDHTNLSPQSGKSKIAELCEQAKVHGFKSVCVAPFYVALAAELLKECEVLVCTVVGFPLGYSTSQVKAFETKCAIDDGADEIDMVINNCLVADGLYDQVTSDISSVVKAAGGKTVKVILETCLLSDEQITQASLCAKNAGANFVKTSTGFSTGGATENAVKLMKEAVQNQLEVKASGGIRSTEKAKLMVEAGATRLGTSSSIQIVEGSHSSDSSKNDY